jgi:pyruvate/2-oxoglutarate dehydrogenase complex dihydrolipoamide acyltransferase (E2) component
VKEGIVGKCYKKEGDTIVKKEPIVEVISEKATYDLEVPLSGMLKNLMQQGVDVPVSTIPALVATVRAKKMKCELP